MQAALKKRLEEIGLQEYENSAYEEYLGRVDTQVTVSPEHRLSLSCRAHLLAMFLQP